MSFRKSYPVPFKAIIVQETSADIADFNANKGRTDTFTQYIPLPYNAKVGTLSHVMILCDSANNRAFDFIIQDGAQANDQARDVL